jgi:hypothetical protein
MEGAHGQEETPPLRDAQAPGDLRRKEKCMGRDGAGAGRRPGGGCTTGGVGGAGKCLLGEDAVGAG